jgi:hypothetical protein
MAADESAEHEQSRLAAAATGAVGKAHADGVDLDDAHGAALAFSALADAAGDLPLPGRGRTLARWAGLAAVGMVDVTLGRLFEAHADALAICAELGARTEPGQRWGVWAAEGPRATVRAQRAGTGWQLTGS